MKAIKKFISAVTVTIMMAVGWLAAQSQPAAIPLPSTPQLRWQNYEQTMFIHYNPTTWTNREYDDLSLPLSRMNPTKLNTDQWCQVAKSWGARLIVFVAKHTGGFCWWQTNTTEYGVNHIPWMKGKGDVLKMLSFSCKKYGLDLGVYIYPGDEKWGAGIGSGGKTTDPARQEAYNQVFRQQLTEVLSLYGPMKEVWFDGSCVIDVADIIKKYAADAVVFQGPQATIRWVGNESGISPYPNWYTLKSADLKTGIATALHSDPAGDAYAPVEVDLPLLANGGHKWFWAPGTDNLILTPQQLMDVYYRTVGRGAVMLLNSTPDTTGLIPESHVKAYKALGEEITRRFGNPIKTTSGKGAETVLDFGRYTLVNHVIIQEDLAFGQRIRKYLIEGFENNKWVILSEGCSVGQKRIDPFKVKTVSKIRLRITESAGEPVIKTFSAYNIVGYKPTNGVLDASKNTSTIGAWTAETFGDEWKEFSLDLTPYLKYIAQYRVNFEMVSYDWLKDWGLEFKDWQVEMYGKNLPQAVEKVKDGCAFLITRSQQTEKADDHRTIFKVMVRSKPGKTMGNVTVKRVVFE
ncbi:MAG: alpha-L-fucosidase [Bacteroidales bacterium]|jgi:alpha-L-fucosidase